MAVDDSIGSALVLPRKGPAAATVVVASSSAPDELIADWLAGRKETTRRSYGFALADFSRFCGAPSPAAAIAVLLSLTAPDANRLALRYRAAMVENGLAPASVNLRLSALRSLVRLARRLGVVTWALDVDRVRSRPYRDTRGPGREGYRAMLGRLERTPDSPKTIRDRALLHLLYDLALRRSELVGLDVGDFDGVARRLFVVGKGEDEKVGLDVPVPTNRALAAWLAVRTDLEGEPLPHSPLFINMTRDSGRRGTRLTGRSVARVVDNIAAAVGLRTSPHRIRHAAITSALDITRGDVRAVQRFSRHASVQTVLIYDDSRRNLHGEVAALVAGDG